MNKGKASSGRQAIYKLSALGLAAALVACGGGGGGSSATPPVGTVPPGGIVTPGPIVTKTGETCFFASLYDLYSDGSRVLVSSNSNTCTAVVTSVPMPTYAANAPDLAAYNVVNAERQRCGFGLLAHNTMLDAAATAHTNYLALAKGLYHTQDPTQPGFTGAEPKARANAAGYKSSFIGEVISPAETFGFNVRTPLTPAASAAYAVRRLLNAPYHGAVLLEGFRDVGFGLSTAFAIITVKLGVVEPLGLTRSDDVRTYPCAGTTDSIANTNGEAPSLFPLTEGQNWGQPIMVFGNDDLTVTSASIVGPEGVVPVRAIFGKGNRPDPNKLINARTAFVVPTSLYTNSTYSVTINGTNKGVPFTRSFNFTTGIHTFSGIFANGERCTVKYEGGNGPNTKTCL